MGVRLEGFGFREVRRILVDGYELQYELTETEIVVLRIFHEREQR
jgi:hypothetical protein